MANKVKEACHSGQPTIGTFIAFNSPASAEALSYCGFDWLLVDMEHNAIDLGTLQGILQAIAASGVRVLARVPSHDHVFIKRVLDIGVHGILAPMVSNRKEAEAIVAATRYPPKGVRGHGPIRASNWGISYQRYVDTFEDEVIVWLMVETAEGVNNLDEIASTSGVDGLFLGPSDLALSMGLKPGMGTRDEVKQAIDKMLAACKRHKIGAGHNCMSVEESHDWRKRGGNIIGYMTDSIMLTGAAQAGVAGIKGMQQ